MLVAVICAEILALENAESISGKPSFSVYGNLILTDALVGLTPIVVQAMEE